MTNHSVNVTFPEVEALREALREEKRKSRMLRKCLFEASGPMSYGQWSTEFRHRVNKALNYRKGSK